MARRPSPESPRRRHHKLQIQGLTFVFSFYSYLSSSSSFVPHFLQIYFLSFINSILCLLPCNAFFSCFSFLLFALFLHLLNLLLFSFLFSIHLPLFLFHIVSILIRVLVLLILILILLYPFASKIPRLTPFRHTTSLFSPLKL